MERDLSKPTVAYGICLAVLVLLVGFVLLSASALPQTVASHFDADGTPNAFMSHAGYVRFVLLLGVAAPLALLALITATASRARHIKLPHAQYWLAPERIAQTRARLRAHGAWFATLLAVVVACVHGMVLRAHHTDPAHLPAELVIYALFGFLVLSMLWVTGFAITFRRPRRF